MNAQITEIQGTTSVKHPNNSIAPSSKISAICIEISVVQISDILVIG